MEKIGMNGVRYIGNPDDLVSRLAMVGHLYPMFAGPRKEGERPLEYSVQIIQDLEEKVDVIIPGETIDWTVLSYVHDFGARRRCPDRHLCPRRGYVPLSDQGIKTVINSGQIPRGRRLCKPGAGVYLKKVHPRSGFYLKTSPAGFKAAGLSSLCG